MPINLIRKLFHFLLSNSNSSKPPLYLKKIPLKLFIISIEMGQSVSHTPKQCQFIHEKKVWQQKLNFLPFPKKTTINSLRENKQFWLQVFEYAF